MSVCMHVSMHVHTCVHVYMYVCPKKEDNGRGGGYISMELSN